MKTLRELTMIHLMNYISDKPDWATKIFDDEIASTWKREALASDGIDITENMASWCIDELRHIAAINRDGGCSGAVPVLSGNVIKSDTAIPAAIADRLKDGVAVLENVPAEQQDWHPRSDDTVLDLVHPSLYPLVYGRTRILPDTTMDMESATKHIGEGVTIEKKVGATKNHTLNRVCSPSMRYFCNHDHMSKMLCGFGY